MRDNHLSLICPVTFPALVASWATSEHWFKRAAADAVGRGRYDIIIEDGQAYMFRAWVHGWRFKESRDGRRDPDTSKAVLLHHPMRPDHARALHDHPWAFDSEILLGGYTEALPPPEWQVGSPLGPNPSIHRRSWGRHDRIHHEATDLHAIIQVEPDTWTEVVTGPHVRPWGFHPHGRLWVPALAYNPTASDAGPALAVDDHQMSQG